MRHDLSSIIWHWVIFATRRMAVEQTPALWWLPMLDCLHRYDFWRPVTVAPAAQLSAHLLAVAETTQLSGCLSSSLLLLWIQQVSLLEVLHHLSLTTVSWCCWTQVCFLQLWPDQGTVNQNFNMPSSILENSFRPWCACPWCFLIWYYLTQKHLRSTWDIGRKRRGQNQLLIGQLWWEIEFPIKVLQFQRIGSEVQLPSPLLVTLPLSLS